MRSSTRGHRSWGRQGASTGACRSCRGRRTVRIGRRISRRWYRRVADRVAQFVREKRYSAVLAPTHYIQSANSPWLDVDARLTVLLRQYLDRAGAGNVPIFYSLAVSYDVFRSADERGAIIERLADLPIECLWMKISQSGALTHAAVRNLVKGAAEFHSLRVPLIGDMMGGWRGLSALAFGAVGGICHGVTQKEAFNGNS